MRVHIRSTHVIPDGFCTGMKIILIGLLFTKKESDLGEISVTERGCAALISKAESHISLTLYRPGSFTCRQEKLAFNETVL